MVRLLKTRDSSVISSPACSLQKLIRVNSYGQERIPLKAEKTFALGLAPQGASRAPQAPRAVPCHLGEKRGEKGKRREKKEKEGKRRKKKGKEGKRRRKKNNEEEEKEEIEGWRGRGEGEGEGGPGWRKYKIRTKGMKTSKVSFLMGFINFRTKAAVSRSSRLFRAKFSNRFFVGNEHV